jgi:hypothetical protein
MDNAQVGQYGNTAFATLPQGALPQIQQVVVPVTPFDAVTPAAAVPNTGFAAIIDIVVPVDVYLTEIDVNPSANALTNGVLFYIQYYVYLIGSKGASVPASTPYARPFPSPFLVVLPKGSHITVFANATLVGSTLQLAVQGFYIPVV